MILAGANGERGPFRVGNRRSGQHIEYSPVNFTSLVGLVFWCLFFTSSPFGAGGGSGGGGGGVGLGLGSETRPVLVLPPVVSADLVHD